MTLLQQRECVAVYLFFIAGKPERVKKLYSVLLLTVLLLLRRFYVDKQSQMKSS